MEPRFAHDFSQVRVHAGSKPAESAHALSAAAYTVGTDVVFGSGYRPHSSAGDRLLAHELAHVVQQTGGSGVVQRRAVSDAVPVGSADDPSEKEADSFADSVMNGHGAGIGTRAPLTVQRMSGALLQRKLLVDPAETVPLAPGTLGPAMPLTVAVQGLIDETCPSGKFAVNTSTGEVTATDGMFCQWHPPLMRGAISADLSPTPTGCRCLCDVVNHKRTTTIERFKGAGSAPFTTGVGPSGTGPGSPSINTDPTFQGQYFIGGRWVDIPFHLIFSHELCGHALPLMEGTQVPQGPTPPNGTPPHEVKSVDVERKIAAEHTPVLPRRPDDYGGRARPKPP